ncbi:serine/arginine-rich splicing factor SR45a-like isoform X1 [Macadamia integrifolia]|uniref:serine/arginine-rich splicing factor SR45a-like isoform X1 n=1 Tax=Macadamia integrifolia TaxID=60698 RepID=UPI001C530D3F|nr:serine/arginine-rich splicing factor SR45a-like isoform X1 [Macadamia integrifolia]XP_042476078.1 serine/arginine-rich splicing factor SR45a-like isoform X1 [Macadamia integrifolia]
MSYSREGRSPSPSRSRSPPRGRRSRSRSRSRDRSRSRSRDSEDAGNPGNNLYVTGLSTRVTTSDLEKYFNREGKVMMGVDFSTFDNWWVKIFLFQHYKVLECHLVSDPRTRESRGFAFVTMETVEDADRCIKHLNRSVLEGRLITVQKAKRKRGRTPTPGRYHGLKDKRGRDRRRSRSYSPHRRQERDHWRDRRERSRSPYGRRGEEYDSHKRRRDRSLSAGSERNPRAG